MTYVLEILACDPSIYMDHPDFFISDMNHMLRIDTKNLWKTKEKLMR